MKSLKKKSLEYKSTFYSFGNGGGRHAIICEDTPAKLVGSEKCPIESFYVESNLKGQKWLINCSYNSSKVLIGE